MSMRIGRFLGWASVVCLLAGGAWGQPDAKTLPAFDAASVRPFALPAGGWAWGKPDIDPVHLRMKGSPLRDIILRAYGLDDFQLTGLPDWASHEFFTIDAVTDTPTPPDQMLLMLRRLLAERFQLQVEESEKEQPVWAIVVAPGGPKLKPRADSEDCPRGISGDDMKAAGAPRNSMSSFNGCTMADLVKAFNRPNNARDLGRPVIDKTGLTGRYHMIVWQEEDPDETYTGPGMRMSYVEPFREAVEQELGLKLVEDRKNLHFVRVVNVARPSPN
ncbi:MAG TPA: TIGR03435 family protein [Acidobacteriaceae bacterium]|nr:TIGR03435 family protein [Acidobacteriaceae bacterium]